LSLETLLDKIQFDGQHQPNAFAQQNENIDQLAKALKYVLA